MPRLAVALAIVGSTVLAGCTTPPPPSPPAAGSVSCPSPSTDYLLGATFVHVTHRWQEGRQVGEENAAGVRVELHRANGTEAGAPLQAMATNDRGCATFFLTQVGRYRFSADGPCVPAVAFLDWNRTFMDQVEMTVADCE